MTVGRPHDAPAIINDHHENNRSAYLSRRGFCIAMLALLDSPAHAESPPASNDSEEHRGFTIYNVSAINSPRNSRGIISSWQHQIDIAVDCGAKPEIIDFFKTQRLMFWPNMQQPGHFSAGAGIHLQCSPQPPENPVLLHELLHAYHWYKLPDGFQNKDVVHYYNQAKALNFFAEGSYMMTNVQEFFAVTASLYLWGHVSRAPFSRKNLNDKVPVYYGWLRQLLGVDKPPNQS